VFVDRIGVVHVELGLGDDPAEFGNVAAQKPGLGHHRQGLVRVLAADQQVEKQLRGAFVAA